MDTDLSASVSALGVARRSVKAVKQKFKDMKGKVTKYKHMINATSGCFLFLHTTVHSFFINQ